MEIEMWNKLMSTLTDQEVDWMSKNGFDRSVQDVLDLDYKVQVGLGGIPEKSDVVMLERLLVKIKSVANEV